MHPRDGEAHGLFSVVRSHTGWLVVGGHRSMRHSRGHERRAVARVRDHLSEVVGRVEKQRERVTITRNSRAVAVLISPEDLTELA